MASNCFPVVVVLGGAGVVTGPVRLRGSATVAPLDPFAVGHGGHGGEHTRVFDVGRVTLFAPAALNRAGQFGGGHGALVRSVGSTTR
jgi:hypothetical protein